ncbi:MAG: DUF2169 domain-containing protein [Bacteroidota bacterium]
MWAIDNQTPFAARGLWGRDRDGVHEWLVSVKGTYDILPTGELRLCDEQPEPRIEPLYRGEPGSSSLVYDTEVTGLKPTTDIVVNGTAYAPGGRARTSFDLAIQVGPVRKTIRVRGDRWWRRGPLGVSPSSAAPIERVPVVYERAYGGFDQSDPDPARQRLDTRNPVGRGVARSASTLVDQPVYNFEYPTGDPEKAGPAGFGALASYWSPRREHMGTYDEAWQSSRKPLLPLDWDPRTRLCTPTDQQPERPLAGGEQATLLNWTPNGLLQFTLPRVEVQFETQHATHRESHEGQLATVVIEPDDARLTMVWSSALPCRTDIDLLERTIVSEATSSR